MRMSGMSTKGKAIRSAEDCEELLLQLLDSRLLLLGELRDDRVDGATEALLGCGEPRGDRARLQNVVRLRYKLGQGTGR